MFSKILDALSAQGPTKLRYITVLQYEHMPTVYAQRHSWRCFQCNLPASDKGCQGSTAYEVSKVAWNSRLKAWLLDQASGIRILKCTVPKFWPYQELPPKFLNDRKAVKWRSAIPIKFIPKVKLWNTGKVCVGKMAYNYSRGCSTSHWEGLQSWAGDLQPLRGGFNRKA